MADYPILCWSSLSGLHTLQDCWRSSSGSSSKPDQGGQHRVLLAGGRDSSSVEEEPTTSSRSPSPLGSCQGATSPRANTGPEPPDMPAAAVDAASDYLAAASMKSLRMA